MKLRIRHCGTSFIKTKNAAEAVNQFFRDDCMGKICQKSPVHLMGHEECTVLQVSLTR